ncbi:MAG TPA: 3-hydroxyacyl-CoA dehydrogenase NAD-binding domain-containing protein [Candidatus Limnocylindria bacterium]|nr:3-hydroxyacyl-CoA dehydrogenase NAD-binding domain-containing protein [Candidatus Limnocylindria bacterium]
MGAERAPAQRIGVLGAGTMGAGIAQVAAEAGLDVLLHDPIPGAVEKAHERIGMLLDRRVAKGQLTADARNAALARIRTEPTLGGIAGADVVVEAIPEDLALKRDAFRLLDAAAPDGTLLATNTSSLSVAAIAAATLRPQRVLGLHFFNPVPLMALVEVIAGPMTEPAAVPRAEALAQRLGKTPVVAADTPGFIVNRVARPFYLEALRIVGEGSAGVAEVDAALRGIGFRMGPFELVDAIGIDVNYAVSRSVYDQFFGDPRYRPHPLQRRLVDAGRLGRKSGGGFYAYGADGSRGEVWPGVRRRTTGPTRPQLSDEQIAARVLATIVNEAASAVEDGVATPDAIDTAMRLGTNYPSGPLEWGERIGLGHVVHILDALHGEVPDGRYRVIPLLRQISEQSASFFDRGS